MLKLFIKLFMLYYNHLRGMGLSCQVHRFNIKFKSFLYFYFLVGACMAFVYESSLSSEFLKDILGCLENTLDRLRKDGEVEPREVIPPLHRKILESIFPDEVKRMDNAVRYVINEVVSEVDEYRRRVVDALLKMLHELHKEGEEASSVIEAYGEGAVRPFYRILRAMTSMYMDMADVLSSEGFMAAFLTVSALSKKLSQSSMEESKVRVEVRDGKPSAIHSTWSRLAERGVCLICRPAYTGLDVEEICKTLGFTGERLSEAGRRETVRDSIAAYLNSGEASKLSGIIYDALSSNLKDKELEKLLCKYITDHLCTLGEQLDRLTGDIGNEDVKTYINVVFKDRAFLEYEVYSALMRQGIAAIPRLYLLSYDPEYKKRTSLEVDVVAATNSEVWLIEVTSRKKDEGKIKDKVQDYGRMKDEMGADKVVFVGGPLMRKLIEGAINLRPFEGFYYVEFSELYSGISRLRTFRARR
jgi:hypothetical protein